ncbi:discoidin domain-containing protein [Streptomyces shenzhenensis]|uniref:discoidin domain-containing protein n=1 Tax=Streptomyces shenzhenensis TaxID=943815 RepID=UPI0015F0F65E|nr:discoidin domain-containing protein [Streptomyces shenzhenensis]
MSGSRSTASGSPSRRRLGAVLLTVGALLAALLSTTAAAAASTRPALSASQSADDGLPKITGLAGAALAHPAVSANAAQLERIREHVLAKDQPWYGYYTAFSQNKYAQKNYVIANDANPDSPTLTPRYGYANYNTGFFNNQMASDSQAAYYQSLMYYLTGDVAFRAKAMRIMRLWSMLDPSQATHVVDAHIHQASPIFMFNAAAELLRATSTTVDDLKWTQADTDKYVTNYLEPPLRLYMHENDYWFNQQQTAIMAAMSSYIFMDDKAHYDEVVEWATVNASVTGAATYWNGSLSNAFFETDTDYDGTKLDKPVIVVKEMERDQPHAGLNANTFANIARMFMAQGTKVDPVKGTVSTADDAVGFNEFKDDRFLKGTNFFSEYNLGYKVPFNDGRGTPPSDFGRGRYYNFAYQYYYYKYVRGYEDTDPDFEYLADEFRRSPLTTDDSWVDIPDQAAGAPVPAASTEPTTTAGPYETESHYRALDDGTSTETETSATGGSTSTTTYAHVKAKPEGTDLVLLNQFNLPQGTLALRIRTNGLTTAELRRDAGLTPFRTVPLPDTGGQWRYTTLTVQDVPQSKYPTDIQLLFLKVRGDSGTTVDIDHLKIGAKDITPPVFADGAQKKSVSGYVGANLSFSLPATDSGTTQTITYALTGAPEGASVDSSGTVTWKPERPGRSTFYVSAGDGTTVTLLRLTVDVMSSYAQAIDNTVLPYDPDATYVPSTLDAYRKAYTAARAAEGSARPEALSVLLKAVQGLRLLNPMLVDGTLDFSRIAGTNINATVGANLTDSDPNTTTGDRWIGDDKSFVLDFGAGFTVSASAFRIQPRAGFTDRSAGMAVFGSDDGRSWTRLTGMSASLAGMQELPVAGKHRKDRFRFLRFKDLDGGVLNRDQDVEDQPFSLAELRIVGSRQETVNELSAVSLASDGAMSNRAVPGDHVVLSFTAAEDISKVTVTIAGHEVDAVKDDSDNKWTARYEVPADTEEIADTPFTIDYQTAGGKPATRTVLTTDDSHVLISDARGLVADPVSKADVTISDTKYTTGSPASLFDDKLSTWTEFRLGGSGNGAWMTFDFGKAGADKAVKLSGVEILARPSWGSRIAGTLVQGSDDGATWSNLTGPATSTAQWQLLQVRAAQQAHPYRYLRILNTGGWYGNMSELRFLGSYGDFPDRGPVTYTVTATASDGDHGTVSLGLGDSASEGVTTLDEVKEGALVTAEAKPAPGYEFVEWTQSKVVDGVPVQFHVSQYPVYNPGYFTGGYLGGSRIRQVIEDWRLTAHFAKAPTGKPGKPTVSDDDARDGLRDGSFTLATDVRHGNNATTYTLYENGRQIDTQTLTNRTPGHQRVSTAITGRPNGTYVYRVELTNSEGTTTSEHKVVVRDAEPGTPHLSSDDDEGGYRISMNMRWGTNATQYQLYEDGVLIDTQDLTPANPHAQKAATILAGRPKGTHTYVGKLINDAGVTSSREIKVTVRS